MPSVRLMLGDCLDRMKEITDGSVDMILCDLPFGTTQNRWDNVIPFEPMWAEYRRVVKRSGAIVLNASQPFTSTLIVSNLREFKYCWAWNKVNRVSGHLNAKKQPLRVVEDVCVFYREQPAYNPIMVKGVPYRAVSKGRKSDCYGSQSDAVVTVNNGEYYPRNLLEVAADERGTVGRVHPTQKPVSLCEYFIRTYTNEGDTVLDSCMGSGSTGVAAVNTGRNFIGIERDQNYYTIAASRIAEAQAPAEPSLFLEAAE